MSQNSFASDANNAKSRPYSLSELYEKALQKKEFSEVNKAILGSADSRVDQAYSYVFPSLTANGQYNRSRFESDTTSATTDYDYTNVGLNLRQNLFKGGLYSGIRREKTNTVLSQSEVRKRQLDLFQSVANSYYKIQTLENFLEVLRELEKVSDKRVSILKRRVGIGKSKQTDLLTNEIQNQNLKFELQKTITDLKNERELLALATELSPNIELLSDNDVPEIKPFDFFAKSLDLNPEVQIQKTKSEIAKYDYKILRGQHLPTLYVDLDATYGEFTADREGTEYSGLVRLEIPLFEGGRISAESQEAEWNSVIERQRFSELQQSKKAELSNEYANAKKWYDLLKLSEETLKTAERNYKIFNRELELGLVSNLELLNSINTYLETKKNRDESYYQFKTSEVKLSRLVGDKK